MKISDSTSISMPMRNLISIIGAVAVGVWAYFGVVERLNKLETQSVLLEKDMTAEDERLHNEVTKNTDFRIRYPRGELGQSSQDIEQFMLIEDLYKSVERMQKHLDDMANNKVNIEFLKEQMEKAQESIEKLKDADREIVKEHRIQDSMAKCLRGKRTAERDYSPSVKYQCWKGKGHTEIYMGEKSIKAIILE
jgi:DNA-binding protein H-NS